MLALLTHMSSEKVKFKWTAECQKVLNDMKNTVSNEMLLAYPDFNEEFNICVDASDVQLGTVMTQKDNYGNDHPTEFHSGKLMPAQTWHTTVERESLSVMEMCLEFRNVLLGCPMNICADHENSMHNTFLHSLDCVMRWVSHLSEFGPNVKHVKGLKNVAADGLSRAPACGIESK